jgi:hypothetical protein
VEKMDRKTGPLKGHTQMFVTDGNGIVRRDCPFQGLLISFSGGKLEL